MKITSVNNEIVKNTAKLQQRKYREETRLFLLEGDKCIEEGLRAGLKIKSIFVIEGYKNFGAADYIEVSESVMSKISTTTTPPKAVAVAEQIHCNWNNEYKKVILLENIKDAGNLGTIIRTACAFNIDAIVLFGETIDLYNPKCVRSAVGNLWKIPIIVADDYEFIEKNLGEYQKVATLPQSDKTVKLSDFIPDERCVVMFGSEADGLSDSLKKIATDFLTIEMSDKVESLNLSISVGVIAYKISGQK